MEVTPDASRRQTAFTNSEGHVYRLAYDGQSRVIAATNDANEQVYRNFFDPCGNLTNRLDGAGRSTRNQFDVLNRCTNTVYADGSTEAFTFDAAGNLLTAKNAATTNAFGYDAMNRLISSVSRVGGVAFTNLYRRDVGGLATNVVYLGGNVVRYGYNADGEVTNVTDWAGHTWSFTRDAAGRMTGMTYPNGITGAWSYDARHAVSSWNYAGATNLPGRTITRDAMGLKTREEVTGPMPRPTANRRAVNTFDEADRLVSAQVTRGTNVFTETYAYDGCGALTNVVHGTGTNDVYTYDLAGRMVLASTTNNLQSSTGSLFSCSYDALGNRIRTSLNGTNRLWAVNHSDPLKRPLIEADTNGVAIRYYVWGAGRLLAVIDADGSNTTRFAHCDDMGNVVALTDASGSVVFTANYGPYGEPWGATGTNSTPFGWLGGHGVFHVDGGSLYLTRHRAYDTTLKRFLSQDPIGLGGGANLYAYALGNPLVYVDPLGWGAESSLWDDVKNWVSNTASDIANDPMWDALAYTPAGPEYKAAEAVVAGVVAGVVEGAADALKAARYLEGLVSKESVAARGGTEVIQRAMSRAELEATETSGLIRGGRSGTHYVSDAVNSDALRARQRLALPQTPEVRATLEVPSGRFSPPSRVPADYNMPGGGMQRTGSGEIPARTLRVEEY